MINQRGLSLVEGLIATFVIAVTAVATTQLVSSFQTNARFVEEKQNRDGLFETVSRLASSPAAIFLSATSGGAANTSLAACALGQSGASACRSGAVYGFELYSLDAGTKASGPVGGTGVFYDIKDGRPCVGATEASAKCPTELRTSFEPYCLDGAPACKQALTLKINYEIIHQAGTSADQSVGLRNVSGSILVDTQQVSLFKEQITTHTDTNKNLGCGRNEMVMGFDGTGNAFCQKLDHLCPPGQYAIGIDQFGRPLKDMVSATFDPVLSGVECVAAEPTVPGSVMVAMNIPAGGPVVSNNWLTAAIQCPPGDHSVLKDIISPGVADCHLFTQTCQAPNVDGTQVLPTNFTAAFNTYNGPTTGPVVSSQCQPWGCVLNAYQGSWTAQNNCIAHAVPACVPTAPVCGPANGVPRATAPSGAQLCSSGTDSGVSGAGPWTWECDGSCGNTSTVSCSSPLSENGRCGTAHLSTTATPPAGPSQCAAGTPTAVAGPNASQPAWTWDCTGTGGGSTISCWANAPPINPQCNVALQSGTYPSPPPGPHCTAGIESNFSGPQMGGTPSRLQYTWDCLGLYGGGPNVSCFADFAPAPVPGLCGPNYDAPPYELRGTAPTTDLCDPSTPTVTAAPAFDPNPPPGRWVWTCDGTSGGPVSATCQADYNNLPPTPPVCGSSSANASGDAASATAIEPSANLCGPGTMTAMTPEANKWSWTCNGINGDTSTVSCYAPRQAACGPAQGTTTATSPSGVFNLCSYGSPSADPVPGPPFNWSCANPEFPAVSQSCFANTNGVCNAVTTSGGPYQATDVFSEAQMCTTTSTPPTQVNNTSTFNWTCTGYNAGAGAGCSAAIDTTPGGKWCLQTAGETACGFPAINPMDACAPGPPVGWVNQCPGATLADVYQCVPVANPCPGSSCPATTLSWTQGPDSCSAAVPQTGAGSSVAATDSSAPTTGDANFACTAGGWQPPTGATCTSAPPPMPCGPRSMEWTCTGGFASGPLACPSNPYELPPTAPPQYYSSDYDRSPPPAAGESVTFCIYEPGNWSLENATGLVCDPVDNRPPPPGGPCALGSVWDRCLGATLGAFGTLSRHTCE